MSRKQRNRTFQNLVSGRRTGCPAPVGPMRLSRLSTLIPTDLNAVIILRRTAVFAAVGLAAVLVLCGGRFAAAQEGAGNTDQKTYREIRDVKEVSRGEIREITSAMRGGSIPDRALFERYFNYRIAEFTWPENRHLLHAMRDRLKKQDLQQAAGSAYEALNALLLKRMTEIASGEAYHPAVRLNAVLLLGKLDRNKPNFSGKGFVPLPDALPVLMARVKPDSATAVDDALMVAALTGIRRQAEAEQKAIDPKEQQQIVETMLAVLNSEKPDHRNLDVDGWVRRRAAEVLSAIGASGTDSNGTAVVDALLAMTANDKLPITSRCAAADAVGHLDLTRVAKKIDAKQWLRPLAMLAHEVTDEETSVGPVIYYLESVRTALLGRATKDDRRGGLVSLAKEGDSHDALAALSEHIGNVVEKLVSYGINEPDLPEDFPQMVRDLEKDISSLIGPEHIVASEEIKSRPDKR